MYSKGIEGVIRAFSHGDSPIRTFKSGEGVANVVRAIDVGVCRLVPVTDHAVRLFDTAWGVELGIELTPHGEHALARAMR